MQHFRRPTTVVVETSTALPRSRLLGRLFAAFLCAGLGCQSKPSANFTGGSPRPPAPTVAPPSQDVVPVSYSALPAALAELPPPITMAEVESLEKWDVRVDEALQLALANSEVMRDAGGRVLSTPTLVQTVYEPAMAETSPLRGPQAALSEFDATVQSATLYRSDANSSSSVLLGNNVQFVPTDVLGNVTSISKRTAVGSRLSVSGNTESLRAAGNGAGFDSYNTASLIGRVSQPLLQGAGVDYNRIAGSSPLPGNYNGVLIGRINTDISVLDFEAAVRTLLIDVERAYWELAFAYRDFDARTAARNAALETWRLVQRKREAGALGFDEEAEARVREQYYVLQAQVENSLVGSASPGAALAGGGGGFGGSGVLAAERRLRQIMGLPPNDGRLIRPITEPAKGKVVFDWQQTVAVGLSQRIELRRQGLTVRRRELELIASRNLLLPSLDAVGSYGVRTTDNNVDPLFLANNPQLALNDGGQQSGPRSVYSAGLVFSAPLGNRIGKTAVRNAQLSLARERALLREQQMQVAHEISGSIMELDRAAALITTNFHRREAAQQQLRAVTQKYDNGATSLDFVLDAQRRMADAESAFQRSVIDYNRAIAEVHLVRGTLLDYDGVQLNEGVADRYNLEEGRMMVRRQAETTIDYRFASR